MTIISPTIPKKTTKEEPIAKSSHGAEDLSRVDKALSNAEMELFKADMQASEAEASLGNAEAAVAKACMMVCIMLLGLLVAISVIILALRRDRVYK
jgi:hypothetical protein